MNLQENKNTDKSLKFEGWLSWPAIAVTCIVFWPVGLFLIWRRTSLDKKAAFYSGKVIEIFGWGGIVFSILGMLGSTSEGAAKDTITGIIFFALGGIVLVFLGRKIKSNAKKSKKYISIIINEKTNNIDNIAAEVPTTYDNAKKDLQKMIDQGYFEGAYINESTREIILSKRQHEAEEAQSIKMQGVTCSSCGANNSIAAGTASECEFCGSYIEAK